MTTEDRLSQSMQENHTPLQNPSAPLYYLPVQSLETNQGSQHVQHTQNVQNVQPINNNSVDGSSNIVININKGYLKSFVYGLVIIGSAYSLYKHYKGIMYKLTNMENYLKYRTSFDNFHNWNYVTENGNKFVTKYELNAMNR